MSKRDGMPDIFHATLKFVIFCFLVGGVSNVYKFPPFNLSLPCHFLQEGR